MEIHVLAEKTMGLRAVFVGWESIMIDHPSTTYLYNRVGLGPECISSRFDGFACCTGHAKRGFSDGELCYYLDGTTLGCIFIRLLRY